MEETIDFFKIVPFFCILSRFIQNNHDFFEFF